MTISRMNSSFPSEIEIINGKVHTFGGLILLKLKRKSKLPYFRGTVNFEYDDSHGQHYKQEYKIDYEFHPEEQFFSEENLLTALQAYTFVSEMRELLELNDRNPYNKKMEMFEKYWPMIV